MRSIPVWSITEASYPERESQLQTTYSPKIPTIFVWRVPFSTLRLMVAPSYRESSAGGRQARRENLRAAYTGLACAGLESTSQQPTTQAPDQLEQLLPFPWVACPAPRFCSGSSDLLPFHPIFFTTLRV